MKGDAKIIKALNEVLTAELTAINQYIVHAEMCENWKYERLAKRVKMEAIDEMKHAEKLIERILYLEGTPNVTRYSTIKIGKQVKEQIKHDLRKLLLRYKDIGLAREVKDNGSRELFEQILLDEEEHVDWLEAQLDQIEQMGYEFYLSQQVKGEAA